MTNRTSLMLADDHVASAHALSGYLREWYAVLSPSNTLEQLQSRLVPVEDRPDVVLLDVSFGERSGIRELPSLLTLAPEVRFVMLSAHGDEAIVDGALQAGATGYVHKSCGFLEIRQAIDGAVAGRSVVFLEGGYERAPRPPGLRPRRPLTAGLKRVLRVLKKKYGRVESARILGCSIQVLDASIARLRENYGLRPREHIDWDTLEIE